MQTIALRTTTSNLTLGEIQVKMINLIQRFKSGPAAAMDYIEDLLALGIIKLHKKDEGEEHYKFVSDLNDFPVDEHFDYGFTVYRLENGFLVHTKFGDRESLYEF